MANRHRSTIDTTMGSKWFNKPTMNKDIGTEQVLNTVCHIACFSSQPVTVAVCRPPCRTREI